MQNQQDFLKNWYVQKGKDVYIDKNPFPHIHQDPKFPGFGTSNVPQVGLGHGAKIPGASVLTQAIGGMDAGSGSMVAEMAKQNAQFMALQNAVQMESRKFQTLSNVAKARHDIAMSAIRNTRA